MKKYHQNEGACPSLDNLRLYLDIEAFCEFPQIEAIIDGTYFCQKNTNLAVKKFLIHRQRPTTISDMEPLTLMSLVVYRESWEKVE